MANPGLTNTIKGYRESGPSAGDGVTTIDTVVQKTAMTLGVLLLTAFATWAYIGGPDQYSGYSSDKLATVSAISFAAAIATLGLSFFISFSKKPRPAFILLFAALEGVVIGAFSKFVTIYTGDANAVVGAVLGTIIAFVATLAVYKFFDIQVTSRMRRIVTIAMFAFVGISLVDLVLSFFGAAVGVNGFGGVGVLFSFVGVAIALFMLIMDFDAVEQAIAYRLPEVESWRLAFGLTVTLVWLYINLLKILTYVGND